MADLLGRGAAFLHQQRRAHLSRAVVYRRGAASVEVLATAGRTEFEQADEAGLIHRVESRDFLIRAADLVLGGGPVQPRAGDQVRETAAGGEDGGGGEGGQVLVYEVNAPGGRPPWRYSDPQRTTLRIHTKHIGTEAT